MRRKDVWFFATATVLSHVVRLTVAHGDEHDVAVPLSLDPASSTSPSSDSLTSYFAHGTNSGSITAHVSLMVLAWVFILPVGVMFSISGSRLALPSQFLFLIINAIGLFFGIVFNTSTPDLYPNNAHHKVGWFVTWLVTAQVVMSVLLAFSTRNKRTSSTTDERAAFLPLPADVMAQLRRGRRERTEDDSRWSGDSGQGTEPPSPSEDAHSMEGRRWPLFRSPARPEPGDDVASENGAPSGRRLLRGGRLNIYLTKHIPGIFSKRILSVMSVAIAIVDRTILPLGFAVIATGGVTYAGIMRGDAVFNGLAHFVKGGIFFWYGLLTLGRWMGSFADLGWAWNVKPARGEVSQWKARVKSGEFVESAVIFAYGFTNVWLEHLAAWGDAWVAQDLEHVSISIMFLGGGLCGMLVESRTIRNLLNTSVGGVRLKPNPTAEDLRARQQPEVYRAPMNPMPALVILLLGVMMSSHHQSSMVSTTVHKQWGTLLVGFSLARGVTYILLYLAPPSSIFPSRPPSELISAFCLISGGLIFMASNKDVIAGMEFYKLNAMFIFTVGMGLTAFLMAWEVAVLAIKGWAVQQNNRTSMANKFAEIKYED